MDIRDAQEAIHATAVEHGWWELECNVAEKLALMHSELSEALEEYRSNKPSLYFDGDKPEGIIVELADCIIRILDLVGFMNWDIEAALRLKMDYNETRPYRHGNKKI